MPVPLLIVSSFHTMFFRTFIITSVLFFQENRPKNPKIHFYGNRVHRRSHYPASSNRRRKRNVSSCSQYNNARPINFYLWFRVRRTHQTLNKTVSTQPCGHNWKPIKTVESWRESEEIIDVQQSGEFGQWIDTKGSFWCKDGGNFWCTTTNWIIFFPVVQTSTDTKVCHSGSKTECGTGKCLYGRRFP